MRLEEPPSRCGLAGVSDGCERSLGDAIDVIPVLLPIFGSALPFIDGRKNGIVGNGLLGSPPLLLLFMAPWCLSDPSMRSLTPMPPIVGGLKPILLPAYEDLNLLHLSANFFQWLLPVKFIAVK